MKTRRHGNRRSHRKLRRYHAEKRRQDAEFRVWMENCRKDWEICDKASGVVQHLLAQFFPGLGRGWF